MMNGVTAKYLQELDAQISAITQTILRGVSSYEEYKHLTGKLNGLQEAQNMFNEILKTMEMIDE